MLLRPIFALKSWVQASRFDYNGSYEQKTLFLTHKGGPEMFSEFVVGLKSSEIEKYFPPCFIYPRANIPEGAKFFIKK